MFLFLGYSLPQSLHFCKAIGASLKQFGHFCKVTIEEVQSVFNDG